MTKRLRSGWLGCLALTIATVWISQAAAQSAPLPADEPFRYSEVRLGVLAHDVRFAGGLEGGVDLNGEYTTSTLVNPDWTAGAPLWVQWLLHPRAHIGVEPNLNGKTSQIYGGVTWTAELTRTLLRPEDGLEFSFMFGPALNDGEHSPHVGHKPLGSSILFHLVTELSYRITPRFAVGLYFDHSSNGGNARYNASLNDFGLRVGYRF